MCNREGIKCGCATFKACLASLYTMTYELKTNEIVPDINFGRQKQIVKKRKYSRA